MQDRPQGQVQRYDRSLFLMEAFLTLSIESAVCANCKPKLGALYQEQVRSPSMAFGRDSDVAEYRSIRLPSFKSPLPDCGPSANVVRAPYTRFALLVTLSAVSAHPPPLRTFCARRKIAQSSIDGRRHRRMLRTQHWCLSGSTTPIGDALRHRSGKQLERRKLSLLCYKKCTSSTIRVLTNCPNTSIRSSPWPSANLAAEFPRKIRTKHRLPIPGLSGRGAPTLRWDSTCSLHISRSHGRAASRRY